MHGWLRPRTQSHYPITPKSQRVATNIMTRNHKRHAWCANSRGIEPSPIAVGRGGWDAQAFEDEWDTEMEALVPRILGA
jgi:hypothetical protein